MNKLKKLRVKAFTLVETSVSKFVYFLRSNPPFDLDIPRLNKHFIY